MIEVGSYAPRYAFSDTPSREIVVRGVGLDEVRAVAEAAMSDTPTVFVAIDGIPIFSGAVRCIAFIDGGFALKLVEERPAATRVPEVKP